MRRRGFLFALPPLVVMARPLVAQTLQMAHQEGDTGESLGLKKLGELLHLPVRRTLNNRFEWLEPHHDYNYTQVFRTPLAHCNRYEEPDWEELKQYHLQRHLRAIRYGLEHGQRYVLDGQRTFTGGRRFFNLSQPGCVVGYRARALVFRQSPSLTLDGVPDYGEWYSDIGWAPYA